MKPRLSEKTPNYICAYEERKTALYLCRLIKKPRERIAQNFLKPYSSAAHPDKVSKNPSS
jgi:hypothetical protein